MSNVTDAFEPTSEPVVQPQKSSRGCLYGCLFVVASGIALLICAGVGGYWFITGQVEKYTSATPVELPAVDFTPEQLVELENRVEAFTKAFDEGKTPEEDLELTAEELNALISKDENLRGKIFVRIEDGQVSGDVSIPTDAIPGGKGRYFNGSASFNVSMHEGVLIVTLADAEVNGERLPQEAIDAMAHENLAKDVYKDPENAKVLRKFENVSVEGDKIILRIRRGEKTEDASPADPDQAVDDSKPTEEKPAVSEEPEVSEEAAPEAAVGDQPATEDDAVPPDA